MLLLFFLFIDVEEEILQGFAWDYVSVALAILVFPAFYLIYLLFFKSFFGAGIGAALLIWRFFSYYANIIFGALLSAHEIGFKSRSRS